MRTIRLTTKFKRDYRRAISGQFGEKLPGLLADLLRLLVADDVLPPRNRDHALTGRWNNHRDCHVRPDMVLIYRKPDPETLELVRLGSHSELGL